MKREEVVEEEEEGLEEEGEEEEEVEGSAVVGLVSFCRVFDPTAQWRLLCRR